MSTLIDNDCPVGDPECLSNDDQCHDACESPAREHTATPWEIDEDRPQDIARADRTAARLIGTVFDHEEIDPEEAKANALFIVKAVNSHDALYTAMQGLFEHCAMIHKHWGEGSNQKEADNAIADARAALALVDSMNGGN